MSGREEATSKGRRREGEKHERGNEIYFSSV